MIRAILVDDEPRSLQLLEKTLKSHETIEVVHTYSNAESVVQQLNDIDFDVAFLDIEMAGLSGLELAEIIYDYNADKEVVFVTAYRDYAIQAFELNAVDYLLKPVLKDRLEKTIARLQHQFQQKQHSNLQQQTPSLKVHYFNEFTVFNHNEMIKWKTAKVKELFAYLLMHHHTYINRDTLIHVLWPEQDYKKAKIMLHTNISYLRKTLEAAGIKNALKFSNPSYLLQIENVFCDVIEFERFLNQHSQLSQQNIAEAEQIVLLYTGDYAEKNAYEWAVPQANLLKEKLLSLLQQLIAYFTETGNRKKQQHYLQLWLKHDPYSETTLRKLLQHYLDSEKRIEAIQLYKKFAALLEEDLGIKPEPETMNLVKNITN